MGHVGDQLYLHPFAAGLLCQGPVQARLNVVQLLRGLMQVCVRRQVQGRFQIPVPDGRHLVRQQADIPDQGPVPPDPEDFQDPYQRKGGKQKRRSQSEKSSKAFHTQGHSREQL